MRAFFALLIFIFSTPVAIAADLHFDFRTFKVRTHFTEAAAPLRWNQDVFPFEVAFKYGSYREMANQPHRWFGGKYVLVEAGCGTSCQVGVLVNRQTGQVVPDSNLPLASSSYEYRYNSALLVVNPTDPELLSNRDSFPDPVTYYFVWTTTGWKKLAEEPWPTDSLDAAGKAIQAALRKPTPSKLQQLFDSVDGWDTVVDEDRVPIPAPRPYN